jgi:inward rectifier potassium channel
MTLPLTKAGSPPSSGNGPSADPFDGTEHYFSDFYHHLITSSWPFLLLQIAIAFVVANSLFAVGYYLDGGVENARPGSFADVFFFSVETMATIGYGKMAPATLLAHILMSIEALTGLISLALVTGLIFSKFSRPTARVRFSRWAVISNRDGVPSLMFRTANVRANEIVEAQIHVVLARQERTAEGEDVRRFYDLELSRYRNPIFSFSWTAIHPITPASPLYGATPATLTEADAAITVSLTGLDETFSQTVYTRYSYEVADIVWGARLADIRIATPGGGYAFDYSQFDEVVPAEMPVWESERAREHI